MTAAKVSGVPAAGVRGRRVKGQSNAVAFVAPGWPPGQPPNGVVSYVASMREALGDAGVRALVLAQRLGPNGPAHVDIVQLKSLVTEVGQLRRYAVKMASAIWPHSTKGRLFAASINGAIRRDRGVALVEMEESFGWAQFVAARSRVPVVVRLHGPWFLNGRAQGVKQDAVFERRARWEGFAIARAAGVTAPSRDVLQRVRSHYGLALPNAAVIPNPMGSVALGDRWTLEGCCRDHILFVGRFDRHKGGDTIIEAFTQLIRVRPSARLTFIGPDPGLLDGSGRRVGIGEYMKRRCPGLLENRRIEWLGPQPHDCLGSFRRRAQVTVVCSRFETFGITATEAMSYGCPVVVSKIGGLAEIVEHGRNGLLCMPGDAEDVAEKVLTLLDNDDLTRRLGHQARVDCDRRFGPQRVALKALDFYEEVLQRWKSTEI